MSSNIWELPHGWRLEVKETLATANGYTAHLVSPSGLRASVGHAMALELFDSFGERCGGIVRP